MSDSSKGVKHIYGQIDRDYGAKMFMTPPEEDGDIFMLNFMKYKEVADYANEDGEEISGMEADDRYNPTEILHKIGAEVMFIGLVVEQIGNQSPKWDRIGTVRYASRKSFTEMQNRSDFKEKHVHKAAGMSETFICCGLPMEDVVSGPIGSQMIGIRPIVSVSAHRVLEGTSVEDLKKALLAGVSHMEARGARVGKWFAVEGTIIGDGRGYDINCYDQYASQEDFHAVREAMQADPACAPLFDGVKVDSYTVLVRPNSDKIGPRI